MLIIKPIAMASGTVMSTSKYADRNIMTGNLGNDFLRIQPNGQYPVAMGYGVPGPVQFAPYQSCEILSITVVQAKLAKNYGLSRMDPYCRLRIGPSVFETAAAYNGAKNPRWNKLVQCPIKRDVGTIYVEVYDECTFSIDDRIAWGLVPVKDEIFSGEVSDQWYPLSGKQGDGKEGMINLVIQYREGPLPIQQYTGGAVAPPYVMYGAPAPQVIYPYPTMVTTQTMIPQASLPVQMQPQAPLYTDEDVKNVKDMFPSMEDDVIRSILDSNGGNIDQTVNALLAMTADS